MGNDNTIACFNAIDLGRYDYDGLSAKPSDIDFSHTSCQLGTEGQFDVNVDFDIDLTGAEGCHGTDVFFQDDPVKLKFAVFKNGDVLIRGINHYRILLTSNNKLFLVNPAIAFPLVYELDPLHHLPVAYGATGGGGLDMYKESRWIAYALDATFYQCIRETTENVSLTIQQQAVVERFFSALSTTFPADFGSQQ